MKTSTALKIRDFIKKNKQVTAKQITDFLLISPQAVHRQLRKLHDAHLIEKIGTPPKVYYFVPQEVEAKVPIRIDPSNADFIQKSYLYITPLGMVKQGIEGFLEWCESRGQDPEKASKDYVKTFKKYERVKKSGLIDGLPKAEKTFDCVHLDKLFYLDFYSIERFGKTKMGQLLLYAKQSQNRKFIRNLTEQIKPKIESLIKRMKIDAICFIPPTVKRQVQLMNELKRGLGLDLPILSIKKLRNEIPIPQKTLNKLPDRIENARRTIVVDDERQFKKVLLIDDAVGSGATLNETAHQIKVKKIAKKVIGLAITGSFKGFDVISEV